MWSLVGNYQQIRPSTRGVSCSIRLVSFVRRKVHSEWPITESSVNKVQRLLFRVQKIPQDKLPNKQKLQKILLTCLKFKLQIPPLAACHSPWWSSLWQSFKTSRHGTSCSLNCVQWQSHFPSVKVCSTAWLESEGPTIHMQWLKTSMRDSCKFSAILCSAKKCLDLSFLQNALWLAYSK